MRASHFILALSALLPSPAGAAPWNPEVLIVDRPWTAPFGAEELAEALRLRVPGTRVAVASEPDGAAPVFVRSAGGAALVVDRAREGRVELGLDGADADEARRRAAILIAMILDQPLAQRWRPSRAERAAASPPTGELALSRGPGQAPERKTASWAAAAQLGPAFAVGDEVSRSTLALTLVLRRYLGAAAALDLGAKLAGAYSARRGSQTLSVSDRAVFLGAHYELRGPRLGLGLSTALQYTHPFVDTDGAAGFRDAPVAARFGARAGADFLWFPRPALALVLTGATTFAFAERDYNTADGGDLLELGSAAFDLCAGAQVRW